MKFLLALALLTTAPSLISSQLDEATCVEETTALAANADLQAAVAAIAAAIEADVSNDLLGFCNLLQLSCDLDATDYSADYMDACSTAGGQTTTKSKSATCTGSFGAVPVPEGLTFSVTDWPLCVGVACDPMALPADVEQKIDDTVNELLANVTAATDGAIMCEVTSGPDPTSDMAMSSTSPAPADASSASPAPADASSTSPSPVDASSPSPVDASSTSPVGMPTEAPPTTPTPATGSATSGAYEVGAIGAVFSAAAALVGM